MVDRIREASAIKFRQLLDQGVPRKQARFIVIDTLRKAGHRCSKTQLYAWCRKFGVNTR